MHSSLSLIQWVLVATQWHRVLAYTLGDTTKSKHTEKTTSETLFFSDKVPEIQPEALKFSVTN